MGSSLLHFPRKPGSTNGGQPPDNDDMEARVSKLEDFAQDTRDRLTRIESTLSHNSATFATKEDLAKLEVKLHESINAQTWKFVTWMTGICTALIAATYFIVKNIH